MENLKDSLTIRDFQTCVKLLETRYIEEQKRAFQNQGHNYTRWFENAVPLMSRIKVTKKCILCNSSKVMEAGITYYKCDKCDKVVSGQKVGINLNVAKNFTIKNGKPKINNQSIPLFGVRAY